MSSEWMMLIDAVDRVTELVGNRKLAKLELRDALGDGQISSRGHIFKQHHRNGRRATELRNYAIPASFWSDRECRVNFDGGDNAAIRNGRFKSHGEPIYSFEALGVQIERAAVERKWGSPSGGAAVEPPVDAAALSSPAVDVDELSAFLMARADGKTSEQELRKSCTEHFSPRIFTDKVWRAALKPVPDRLKLRPGQNKRTLAAHSRPDNTAG